MNRDRQYLRGEQTVADLEAELVAPEEIYQEVRRMCPEAYDGTVGRELFDYEHLHLSAIRLLHEAEDYLCPNRAATLANTAETLDLEALPEDFFQRLVVVQNKITALGRKRPRTRSRDEKIRDKWRLARGTHLYGQRLERQGTMQSYAETIAQLAEMFGYSEKTIEAVVSSKNMDTTRDETTDYDRLTVEIEKRFSNRGEIAD